MTIFLFIIIIIKNQRFVNNSGELYGTFARLFNLDVNNSQQPSSFPELKSSLQAALGSALLDLRLLYVGYWDHPLNTDNAWNEVTHYVMRLSTSQHHSPNFPLPQTSECRCTWTPLSQQTITALSLTHAQAVHLLEDYL